MYRQIKYLLVETKPTLKISQVIQANFTPTGIASIVTSEKQIVIVDWSDTFLVEFTGKFDKDGKEIFTADILEIIEEVPDGAAITHLYSVGWANGGFTATHLKDMTKGFPLFDENLVMQSRKVGNQFEHQQIIIDYLKLEAEEKMVEGEISGPTK